MRGMLDNYNAAQRYHKRRATPSRAIVGFNAESHARYMALGEGDKCEMLVPRDMQVHDIEQQV
eukprot:4677474-Pyramimonas_sp.AAC.1